MMSLVRRNSVVKLNKDLLFYFENTVDLSLMTVLINFNSNKFLLISIEFIYK